MCRAPRNDAKTGRFFTSRFAAVLGLAFGIAAPSAHVLARHQSRSNPAGTAARSGTGDGVIAGCVVDEYHEPVARATVQAFSRDSSDPHDTSGAPSLLTRASGSDSTNTVGCFRIAGLALREYLVAAAAMPLLPAGGAVSEQQYGVTFYPSTIDERQAVGLFASADATTSVRIELVPVRGSRVAGSVASTSGQSTRGLKVTLSRRVGSFGVANVVGTVDDEERFETSRLAPGRYRLTIERRPSNSATERGEFTEKLVDLSEQDIENVSLVLREGASVSGRVVGDPDGVLRTPVGVRVGASRADDELSGSTSMSATLGDDWSFRMTGLSGSYQFTVSGDTLPPLAVSGVTVDGVRAQPGGRVELTEGTHEVVVTVAHREPPTPTSESSLSTAALVERFKTETVFWRQFTIAEHIVARRDASVLASLEDLLTQTDRHLRGNVAFIFAALGDPRGFEVVTAILNDGSYRPEGQGVAIASSDLRYRLERQIAADRYYAAHLLGDLRDPRAIPLLAARLTDPAVRAIVPWALGRIGDTRAIASLLDALDQDDPTMRVLVIDALTTLHATEAVPRLTSLLNDERQARFGAQVSVAAAAKAAIEALR